MIIQDARWLPIFLAMEFYIVINGKWSFMVIFHLFICKIVPLKHDSLITRYIPMDPKHSIIKEMHCIYV